MVDLLVFGPIRIDLEIGLGGSIAKHVALGHTVGLCDLTRGEMGTNGTPDERVAEAEAARVVLGALSRDNLGLPDGDIGGDPSHLREVVACIRRMKPKTIAAPHGGDRHPDHVAAHRLLTRAAFLSGLSRYGAPGENWRARLAALLFHQRFGAAVVCRRRVGEVWKEARRAGLPRVAVRTARPAPPQRG